jgi:ATPase subunit of ABC transporter with duplicated ATPase domains
MSAFLTLDSIALATPDGATLAADLTLSFARERTGILGRNGAGKSTLLHVLAGRAMPAAGTLTRNGSVGLMDQSWPDDRISAATALGIADALARLRRLEAGDGTPEDLAEADWALTERVDAALDAVGLDATVLSRPVASFSGGERTRLAIARVQIAAPDLLLLDEPTNNLDAAGQALIGTLVRDWRGGVVVAGHDRLLLDRMDRIVELSATGYTVFGGGWSAYRAARSAALARAEAQLEHAERDARQIEREVEQRRERKATRDRAGRMAQRKGSNSKLLLDAKKGQSERTTGRDNALAERLRDQADASLEAARVRIERLTPLRIELPSSGIHAGRQLVRFEGVDVVRGGRNVLAALSFELRGAQRIALLGPNGAGKTTLLNLVAGVIAPSRGTVWIADKVVAMLDQHVGILDPAASVLDNLRRLHPDLSDHQAHEALARFAFRNRAADRIVATLSGGERLRAGLAVALSGSRPPQLLLLDEPTNHLDVESIEILEAALGQFDGALLVASHDRAFLGNIGLNGEIVLPGRGGTERSAGLGRSAPEE